MFDIGFPELVLVGIVALLVLGPDRLPQALRTLGLWLGRLRRSYFHVKTEIEREIGMDEVRRQLHNEQIMEEVKRMEREVQDVGSQVTNVTAPPPPAEGPPPSASPPEALADPSAASNTDTDLDSRPDSTSAQGHATTAADPGAQRESGG